MLFFILPTQMSVTLLEMIWMKRGINPRCFDCAIKLKRWNIGPEEYASILDEHSGVPIHAIPCTVDSPFARLWCS